MIHFVHPHMFLILLAVPLLSLLHGRYKAWQIRHQHAYAEPAFHAQWGLGPRGKIWGYWRLAAWCWTLAALVFCLAGPQWIGPASSAGPTPAWSLYLVLDASLSMQTQDVAPSRWGTAKKALRSLVQALPGIPMGLVVFEGEARFACPPTLDRWALLQAIDQAQTRRLPQPGSALESGVQRVVDKVSQRIQGLPQGAAVFLVTDGEGNRGGDFLSAVKNAAARQIPVYALGVGTLSGGWVPLGVDFWGKTRYRVFRGQRVVSRLEKTVLQQAALAGGGAYFEIKNNLPPAPDVWAAALRRHPWLQAKAQPDGKTGRPGQVRELFPWGVLGAGLGWLAEFLILALGERKRK